MNGRVENKGHKSRKMSVVLLTVLMLVLCMSVCTACGSSGDGADVHVEGELTDILTQLYADVDIDAETKEAMQGYITDVLTEENAQAFLGTSEVVYTEGLVSVPMMSPIPYQLVLLRVDTGDVETVKKALLDNADLNKWVCTSAETAIAENVGDLVMFVMCEQYVADALSDSFQALK
ncbi:MAG: hypothetical protein NC313_08325 [Butyrivibrio sp.]|nr:hypothetical protein [Butyrivibrio sp.]